MPFNSTNKFQVSIHEAEDKKVPPSSFTSSCFTLQGYLLVMKGAPERIVALCSSIHVKDKHERIGKRWTHRIQEAELQLAMQGERVLGFAYLRLPFSKFPVRIPSSLSDSVSPLQADFAFTDSPPNFPTSGLTFAGFISLIDPPREAVPNAIALCRVRCFPAR